MVRNSTNPKTIFDRRKLLKTVSGSVAGLAAAATVSGSQPDEGTYVGVSYDPLTHQYQDDASAQLQFNDNKLRGQLEAAGFSVQLGKNGGLEPINEKQGSTVYERILSKEQYKTNDAPLKVKLTKHPDDALVWLSRSDPEFGHLAVTLVNEGSGFGAEDIRQGLIGGGDGRPNVKQKSVPLRGLPPRREPSPEASDQ